MEAFLAPAPPRTLEGRVAIVTGAGRGLGRTHALALAARGASVVVNDLGVDVSGNRTPSEPAAQVAAEIRAAGGRAVASGHDVSDWAQAADLVALALGEFGGLDVLVNNAGILRDRSLHNLSEAEWDLVVRIHLKGHAATTRHAFAWWRAEAKAGRRADRSVVMTTSVSGLSGNFGQANYAAAKAGILGLSAVAAIEGRPLGIRSNAVSPGARTRMALAVPGAAQAYAADQAARGGAFDPMDPANVSGVVAWLAASSCPATRQVFHVSGDRLTVAAMPQPALELAAGDRAWTPELLDGALAGCLLTPREVSAWSGFPDGFFRDDGATAPLKRPPA